MVFNCIFISLYLIVSDDFMGMQDSTIPNAVQQDVSQQAAGAVNAKKSSSSSGKPPRPTGVTILAILQILGGLIYIVLGTVEGALIGSGAVIFIAVGAFALITGLALFAGRNWARILVLIGGVLDLLGIPIGTIIGIIILYYFTRPQIKAYFAA
jgi:hypothetical protein